MPRVLIVEDESEMARGLYDLLEYENLEPEISPDAKTALEKTRHASYDLVILDLMLPDMDGLKLCQILRATKNTLPILMLTARGMDYDIVRGLEAGADDYVTKPFSVAQLMARIRALLRRTNQEKAERVTLEFGNCSLDTSNFILLKGKEEIQLTYYEVELIKLLYCNLNQPVSREMVLNKIWGIDSEPTNRTVDNFIAKLRKKIEDDPKRPKNLITIYGLGYKLVP